MTVLMTSSRRVLGKTVLYQLCQRLFLVTRPRHVGGPDWLKTFKRALVRHGRGYPRWGDSQRNAL